jgi:hypothetical protein
VWNELAPQLGKPAVSGSEKYEAAAKVAEWQGLEPRHVADLCCAPPGAASTRGTSRPSASSAARRPGLRARLESWDGVAREERAVLTYLVGELWRRVGDMKTARQWFDRVPASSSSPATQQWVSTPARQQRDCPREWFG